MGADKGETVPLNNSFETSSSNEMENNGISAHHLRPSSSISANHHISETRASAENDANSPFVNHGTFFLFFNVYTSAVSFMRDEISCVECRILHAQCVATR